MDQVLGSGPRSRRQIAVLLAIVAVLAVGLGGGLLWAGSAGPFAAARTPETIYVYPSSTASHSPSTAASAAATAEPEASGTDAGAIATSEPQASGTDGGGIAPEATVAVATPFHPATFTLARPNLEYSYHTVLNVDCGVRFTMNVGVRNSGPVAARATNVLLFDQYPENTTVASASGDVPALAAGASVNIALAFTVNSRCGWTHTLRVRLDAAAVVTETDEEDNFLTLTHEVRAPNLYLTDLTVPAHPYCNAVTVGVRVNNNGHAATPIAGLVKFTDKYSGAPSYSKSVYASFPAIAAGTSRIVSQTFPTALPYCNQTHSVTAVVDPGLEIGEENESDNSATRLFHPDL
jgi:uncharacterized repeat protein (TIGR01451 family)